MAFHPDKMIADTVRQRLGRSRGQKRAQPVDGKRRPVAGKREMDVGRLARFREPPAKAGPESGKRLAPVGDPADRAGTDIENASAGLIGMQKTRKRLARIAAVEPVTGKGARQDHFLSGERKRQKTAHHRHWIHLTVEKLQNSSAARKILK